MVCDGFFNFIFFEFGVKRVNGGLFFFIGFLELGCDLFFEFVSFLVEEFGIFDVCGL